MQVNLTEDQIQKRNKECEMMEKAEKVSMYEHKEMQKRHKSYKRQAKNLAGIKGADKNALEYELLILKDRIKEVEGYLNK